MDAAGCGLTVEEEEVDAVGGDEGRGGLDRI